MCCGVMWWLVCGSVEVVGVVLVCRVVSDGESGW